MKVDRAHTSGRVQDFLLNKTDLNNNSLIVEVLTSEKLPSYL